MPWGCGIRQSSPSCAGDQATDQLRNLKGAKRAGAAAIREIYVNEQFGSSTGSALRHADSIIAPSRHLPVTESVALSPDPRRSIMSSQKSTEQKWREQSEAAREEAAKLPYGKLKNQQLQKARQLQTASQLSLWLSSPGLRAPR